MVSFFKDSSAVSVFWLIIICFGLHVYSLVNPPLFIASASEGFFYYLFQSFGNLQPYIASLLYVLLIFLLALQINFILQNLRMLPKPSYTPALAFILFSALLPAFNVVSPALFDCNILVWILYSACRLYSSSNPKTSIYNFGLLTGLSVILYYPSASLIIISLLALAIIRPFRINEWFVLIFGIITPAYMLTGYLYLTDQLSLLPIPQQLFSLFTQPKVQLPLITITLVTAALITMWSIIAVQGAGKNVLIQVRKSWAVFLIAIVFIMPAIFFVSGAWPTAILLAMVPAACYTGFSFANSRTVLPAIFFWILVALSLYNNWFAKY